MAQKTEKEETEFKAPETLTHCVNDCGFTGNPATNNMCQKCFNAAASAAATGILISPPHNIFPGSESPRSTSTRAADRFEVPALTDDARRPSRIIRDVAMDRDQTSATTATVATAREVNRCSGCRRKVGLTGFRCRCGELFCSEHRYSDRHDCSYDYKSAGRVAIALENPVVKAAKIVRI